MRKFSRFFGQNSAPYLQPMKMENCIRILAGTMVLISVTLTHFVSPWWLLLAVFVGVNLIQSALTGFCPAELILRQFGVGKGECCGPKSN
jgi:hypothetical protein